MTPGTGGFKLAISSAIDLGRRLLCRRRLDSSTMRFSKAFNTGEFINFTHFAASGLTPTAHNYSRTRFRIYAQVAQSVE